MTKATFTELNYTEVELGGFKCSIVGVGLKPANQFTAHPNNPKRHPQKQRDATTASLSQFGWASFVIENKNTGYVLDGHDRIFDAMKVSDTALVPYVLIDLPEDEEGAFLISFDRTGQFAEWEGVKLKEIMESVSEMQASGELELHDTLVSMMDELAKSEEMFLYDSTDMVGSFSEGIGKHTSDKTSMTFVMSVEDSEYVKAYVKDNGQDEFVNQIVMLAKGELYA